MGATHRIKAYSQKALKGRNNIFSLNLKSESFKNSTNKSLIMGQSLVNRYTQIIFSTKNRENLILRSIERELYTYLAGTCNELDSPAIKVGGHLNHVHILCKLSKKIALQVFLQKIKANSSKWIKPKDDAFKNFFWQDGYGAFSVSPSHVDVLTEYIDNQHKHHENTSFKVEYLRILKKNKVEYAERYLWD